MFITFPHVKKARTTYEILKCYSGHRFFLVLGTKGAIHNTDKIPTMQLS